MPVAAPGLVGTVVAMETSTAQTRPGVVVPERPEDLDGLRSRALRAIRGNPTDGVNDADWEPYFTTHGDPFVVERGRSRWGTVAEISTAPADYGKARAEYIGALGPGAAIRILDYITALETALEAAGEVSAAADAPVTPTGPARYEWAVIAGPVVMLGPTEDRDCAAAYAASTGMALCRRPIPAWEQVPTAAADREETSDA